MTGLALFRKSASVVIRTANGASNQAMRLGIPGSIRMMRPEQQSCSTANRRADIVKMAAGLGLGLAATLGLSAPLLVGGVLAPFLLLLVFARPHWAATVARPALVT